MAKCSTPCGSKSNNKPNIVINNKQLAQEKLSVVSVVCRICYDEKKNEPIITPCNCKGTVAFIHRSCLETWLAESNSNACELCHHEYRTERTPRYSARRSIWYWFRHQPQNLGFEVRGLRSDIFACAVLTPLAIIITYVCLFSADYYNQQRFSNIPAARWTSISLLVMISIILIGYYLWVYMVTRYHGRIWYYWWQRECVVRYIPPSTVPSTTVNNNIDNESINTLHEETVHINLENMNSIEERPFMENMNSPVIYPVVQVVNHMSSDEISNSTTSEFISEDNLANIDEFGTTDNISNTSDIPCENTSSRTSQVNKDVIHIDDGGDVGDMGEASK